MSGNYFAANDDAPNGVNDTTAQVQAAVTQAQSQAESRMADAHRFIVENGHEVVGGHADVGSQS